MMITIIIHASVYIHVYCIYIYVIYIYGCESKLCMESSACSGRMERRSFVTGLVPELCSVMKLRLHIYTESNPFNIKQPLNMVSGCFFFLRDGIVCFLASECWNDSDDSPISASIGQGARRAARYL